MSNLSNILTERYVMNMLHTIHDAIAECYDDTGRPLLKLQGYLNTVTSMINGGDINSTMIKDESVTAEKLSTDMLNTFYKMGRISDDDGNEYKISIENGKLKATKITHNYNVDGQKLVNTSGSATINGSVLSDPSITIVDGTLILD